MSNVALSFLQMIWSVRLLLQCCITFLMKKLFWHLVWLEYIQT